YHFATHYFVIAPEDAYGTRPGGFDQRRRFLYFLHSAAMSSEFRMAETTQIRVAPAASTSSRVRRFIPPMANQGIFTLSAAQRTYSRVTGWAEGLVPVG